MGMQKIKRNDEIIVITGKDKGKKAKVMKIVGDRILAEGINLVKKHVKPNPNKNQQGGIQDREATIHVSNVALLNPVSKKADRVGIKTLENGKKVRVYKSNGEVVDV